MKLFKFNYDSSRYYLSSEGYFDMLQKKGIKIKNKESINEVTLEGNRDKYHLVSRGISKLIVLTSNSNSFYNIVRTNCLK